MALSTSIFKQENGKKSFWKGERRDGNVLQIKDEPAFMDVDMKNPGSVSFNSLASRKVEENGSANPVADFEALMARRDSPEWVGKAIQGMKKMIYDLLDSAYNGNTYEKALACLISLRLGCVIQEVLSWCAFYVIMVSDNDTISNSELENLMH